MSGTGDIVAERNRQIKKEGWTSEHDDEHTDGSLATAASCYIISDGLLARSIPARWPRSWHNDWWKPSTRRRDLVKAGALIAAEIDRLDRIEAMQNVA